MSQTQSFQPPFTPQHAAIQQQVGAVRYVTKDFEWRTKAGWLWAGLTICVGMVIGLTITRQFMGIFLPLGVGSALAVGLSRLYRRVSNDGLVKTGSICAAVALALGLMTLMPQISGNSSAASAGMTASTAYSFLRTGMFSFEITSKLGSPDRKKSHGFDSGTETWQYDFKDGELELVLNSNSLMSATVHPR